MKKQTPLTSDADDMGILTNQQKPGRSLDWYVEEVEQSDQAQDEAVDSESVRSQ